MTVSSETNKVIYTCDGSTTVFPYTFTIFEDTDLEVILYTIADGTETTLTLTTHYTVSGAPGTGNVTTVSTYSSAYKLIVRRGLAYKQETDYVENDPFPAETHEDVADKAVMLIQQIKEITDRAIVQDSSQSSDLTFPAASADKIIGWNSGATALENKTNPATAAAASAAAAASSATDAETAQTAAEAAQTAAETAQTNAETAETNAETAETNAETAQAAAEAAAASVPTFTRATFDNGDLSTGVLTVTHSLGLSAPYSVRIEIFDNNGNLIIPDEVTGATNSVAIDLTSYGTLTGTWGYAYLAG